MRSEMSIAEVYEYTASLNAYLQSNAEELRPIGRWKSVFKEWQRWDGVSRVLKAQFRFNTDKMNLTMFIDKETINKIHVTNEQRR